VTVPHGRHAFARASDELWTICLIDTDLDGSNFEIQCT
jgi:hypothetical protein